MYRLLSEMLWYFPPRRFLLPRILDLSSRMGRDDIARDIEFGPFFAEFFTEATARLTSGPWFRSEKP